MIIAILSNDPKLAGDRYVKDHSVAKIGNAESYARLYADNLMMATGKQVTITMFANFPDVYYLKIWGN